MVLNFNILVWRSIRIIKWGGEIKRYKCGERGIYTFIEWRDWNALIEDLRLILIEFLDKRRLIISTQ